MNWVLLGGSLVAVLALAGIAAALRLGGGRIADEAAACDAAEMALPGFEAVAALVGEDGASAVVLGADGSFAVIKQHGAQLAVRRVVTPFVIEDGDGGAVVDCGDARFGRVRVKGVGRAQVEAL